MENVVDKTDFTCAVKERNQEHFPGGGGGSLDDG
jgi:hypothetical protein